MTVPHPWHRFIVTLCFTLSMFASVGRGFRPVIQTSRSTLTTTTTTTTTRGSTRQKATAASLSSFASIPRGAVSVCVRCTLAARKDAPYFLLVQRGQEPNKGQWSFPGGKIEFGEGTVEGGLRELQEETVWTSAKAWESLKWYPDTVCTSDSIGESYHYLIAQCFAETVQDSLPELVAADDADAADWFTLKEIQTKCDLSQATPGVMNVLHRVQELSKHGLLPTVSL